MRCAPPTRLEIRFARNIPRSLCIGKISARQVLAVGTELLPRTQFIVRLVNTSGNLLPLKNIVFTLCIILLNARAREHLPNSYFWYFCYSPEKASVLYVSLHCTFFVRPRPHSDVPSPAPPVYELRQGWKDSRVRLRTSLATIASR